MDHQVTHRIHRPGRVRPTHLPFGAPLVTSPDRPLHAILRRARRALGLSQAELARRIGASQSAISMFENGHQTALAFDKVLAAADSLGVDLSPDTVHGEPEPDAAHPTFRFCPDADCPSAWPHTLGAEVLLVPRLVSVPDTVDVRLHCAWCGEVMLDRCGDCGAPINEGAACMHCGERYVEPAIPEGIAARTWVEHRRAEVQTLHEITAPSRLMAAAPAPVSSPTPHEA